jgi:hypothetical protein
MHLAPCAEQPFHPGVTANGLPISSCDTFVRLLAFLLVALFLLRRRFGDPPEYTIWRANTLVIRIGFTEEP